MLSKYSSVEIRHTRITDVRNHESLFELVADNSAVVQARTIILATGLLALKIAAGRKKDLDDCAILLLKTKIRIREQAQQVVDQ